MAPSQIATGVIMTITRTSDRQTSKSTKIVLGLLTLTGVLGAAIISSQAKSSRGDSGSVNLQSAGDQSVLANGSAHVTYTANTYARPKACRLSSHGIESYQRSFEHEETSPWMGGGYDPGRWCGDVIGRLRGEFPDAQFEIAGTSENSHTTCSPFNCPQYQYYCKVRVKADPVYIEKEDSACNDPRQ
jgi:hypothetical protein